MKTKVDVTSWNYEIELRKMIVVRSGYCNDRWAVPDVINHGF